MVTIFDCAWQMFNQFLTFLPPLIALWLLFDFTGSLLFNKSR